MLVADAVNLLLDEENGGDLLPDGFLDDVECELCIGGVTRKVRGDEDADDDSTAASDAIAEKLI